MNKIFVTGANGFVGKHLVERLRMNGETVTEYHHQDVLPNLSNFDIIYHVAGVLGKRGISLKEYEYAHVELTKMILEKMHIGLRQKIIYMSSAYVVECEKPYELTKLEGEKIVRKSGFNYAIIRPSFIYGEGDLHHLPIYQWIQKWQDLFPIIGNGENIVAPLYIRNLIDAIDTPDKLFETITVAGNSITMNEYIKSIAKALGVKEPHIHIPDNKIYHELLHSDFFTKEHAFTSDYHNITELSAGLATTIKWYKENGYLRK
jgi:nucleoside-diphosphate-sugar epimerase